MSIRERAAFIKGLLQGLDMDDSTPERKLILALVEIVDDLACELSDLSDIADALEEEVMELSEHVEELEAPGSCCSHQHHHGAVEEPLLDLQCPSCGTDIGIDEQMLAEGRFPCPYCGENLEIGDIGEDEPDSEAGKADSDD